MHAADVKVGLIRKLEFWHRPWSAESTTTIKVRRINTTHWSRSQGELTILSLTLFSHRLIVYKLCNFLAQFISFLLLNFL